jgi:hypothetical protein
MVIHILPLFHQHSVQVGFQPFLLPRNRRGSTSGNLVALPQIVALLQTVDQKHGKLTGAGVVVDEFVTQCMKVGVRPVGPILHQAFHVGEKGSFAFLTSGEQESFTRRDGIIDLARSLLKGGNQ